MPETDYVPSERSEINKLIENRLNEVARKERRHLLIFSTFGLFISLTGLIPPKISAIGVEFTGFDNRIFLIFLLLFILYFFITFLIYSITDYKKARADWIDEGKKSLNVRTGQSKHLLPVLWGKFGRWAMYKLWFFLEFRLPFIYGATAFFTVLLRIIFIGVHI